MNEFEQIFANALAESVNEQYEEFYRTDTKYRFSRAYKKQRKKNILSAEKTRGGLLIPPAPGLPKMEGIPFKKRVTVISIAVIMAVGLCLGAGASVAVGFRKEDENKIQFTLVAADAENAPNRIEYAYYLPDVPDGYYLKEFEYDIIFDVRYLYESYDSDDFIFFTQFRKQDRLNFDNEHILNMEDVKVGDKYGVLMTWEDSTRLLWDNGDYVLELFSTLPKEEAMELAKSAKILDLSKNLKKGL